MRPGGHLQDNIYSRDHGSGDAAPALDKIRQANPAALSAPSGSALPDSSDEHRFFRSLGIGKPVLEAAVRRAARNATTIECELLAHGDLEPDGYYEILARILGLRRLEAIPPESVVPMRHGDTALRHPRLLAAEIGGRRYHIVAPEARTLGALAAWIGTRPGLADELAVASPAAIREAVWASRAQERAKETVRALFESDMADSARITLTGAQGFFSGLLVATLAIGAVEAPRTALITAHLVLSVFFFACIMLRIAALGFCRRRSIRLPEEQGLPVYTVAIALYKEAAVVDQLIAALSRLEWPRSLLEIKLICEADDRETLEALRRHRLPPEYEIIRVPPMEPRTKPKALHYALNGARGDFLVIYDAEDRPHPRQLLEAYSIFSRSDERLACLQAPLVVSNGGKSLFSAVFALEYAGLFRGLLPLLARFGLPLPLGGTSNHFRGIMYQTHL